MNILNGCACPLWAYGQMNGQRFRASLHTRSLEKAMKKLARLEKAPEAELAQITAPRVPTVKEAVNAYLSDCRVRSLRESTIRSRRILLAHLEQHGSGRRGLGGESLLAVTPLLLDSFRASRLNRGGEPIRPATARKELEYLRGFLGFCVARKWLTENPAAALKPPREQSLPTQPYTDEEVADLLAASWKIDNPNKTHIERARLRAYALQLVLLHSGLRISDVARLRRSALDAKTGYLTLRALKNGVPVKVKLPPTCLDALDAVPVESFFFFHSGAAAFKTTEDSLRRTLASIGHSTKIHCHPHRYRDTFAVSLLTHGADIRTVQLLLGHQSVKVTEKHYAHFVAAHQALLDAATDRLGFGILRERPSPVLAIAPT